MTIEEWDPVFAGREYAEKLHEDLTEQVVREAKHTAVMRDVPVEDREQYVRYFVDAATHGVFHTNLRGHIFRVLDEEKKTIGA